VAEVAGAASVSRATAYRYFPAQEILLAEVPLDEDAPTVESLFGADAPEDAEDRVALVQNALYDLARDHEAQLRLFLRSSLTRSMRANDGDAEPVRGARRTALLREALAPLAGELAPPELERLANALALLVGVEALVVSRDVLRLGHDKARAAGEWAARRLVRAAREGG
jgi:AcrR family transcriptional regulator